LDVASEACGELHRYAQASLGVLDVASESYGELHRYAQASFGVLDVASEAYGDNPVSHSISQSIIQILTVCSPILTSS
jgi:hypothetical protein